MATRVFYMAQSDERALELLEGLGGRPATPFFEDGPARYAVEVLDRAGVPYELDDFGNIIARLRRGGEPTEPPIAFVAHMDHPGFEVVETDGRRALARAVGGVPAASLARPTPVQVVTPGGRVRGTTARHETTDDPADRRTPRMVWLELESVVEHEPPLPAVFDLPDFAFEGDTIRMRAVDDLAGCAAILAALERLARDVTEAVDVYAVLTRAEEEGLLGARLMAEAGTLPRDTFVVSVESSAVIPGVSQGAGPVIRTGDAAFTFDAEAEQVLTAASERLAGRAPEFRVQRQLMSGGVCEATAFAVNGYRATGLAFPLGNYHNATTHIGDVDGGVDTEYIELSDFLGGVDLIAEAAAGVSRRGETRTLRWVKQARVPSETRDRLTATRGGTT